MKRKEFGKYIAQQHGSLVTDRYYLDTYWQELADLMYAQRAEFTRIFTDGEDLHSHQYNNAPERNRRQLANTIGEMTHPKGRDWFKRNFFRDELEDDKEVQFYREQSDMTMLQAINHPESGYWRSVREADNDFVVFGNKCRFITDAPNKRGIRCKTLHLKDVHWDVDADNKVNQSHYRGELTLFQLANQFGEQALPDKMQDALKDDKKRMSQHKNRVIHTVMERGLFDSYGYKIQREDKLNNNHSNVSIWHCEGGHILDIGGFYENPYLIARWATIGKPYGYSPASTIALPASRELNVMSLLYREGMEKLIDPPMLTYGDAGISEYNLYAGGLTTIEQRIGDGRTPPLAPVGGSGDVSSAFQAIQGAQEELAGDFFQHILALPDTRDMTAAEIYERTAQFNRDASPVIEPWESEYNAPELERIDAILERQGLYPEPPEHLLGTSYDFAFETPLKQARGREKLAKANQVMEFTSAAAQFDPAVVHEFDWKKIARDVRDEGIDCPSEWAASEEDAQAGEGLQALAAIGQQSPQALAELAQQGEVIEGQAEEIA